MTTMFVAVVRPPRDALGVLAAAGAILARATRTTFAQLCQQRRSV